MKKIINLINKSNLLKLLIILVITITFLGYIFNILSYVNYYLTSNLDINILHMNTPSPSTNTPSNIQDPVRWWPSGVPQT